MGVLFISHSTKDNDQAIKVRDWLETQGWGRNQIFLDLENFHSGVRWRNRLDQAGGECEAVIVCLSDNWIASPECLREFNHAETLGKRIFPVMVRPITVTIPSFVSAIQYGDISSLEAEPSGFEKLKSGLMAARIAPNFFPWPPPNEPARSVYRGLQALDVQDAAIFFGRDAHITRGLDELRRLRDGAPQRMLVILGASGAGKSSFLRAGLIARLKRDEENFIVLPIVRPERAAITGPQGLNASLSAATGRSVVLNSSDDLAQILSTVRAPVMERRRRHAEAAQEADAAKPPTIIIPIDQAEELFGAENAERAAFCELVTGALEQDGNTLVVATIRSDSYEALQNGLLPDRQLPFTLPAIPAGSFQEIIEGPARLAKPPLSVEPALTQQLLGDLNAADALPLLAFTLERLQSQFGADGKLTLIDYRDKLGGLSGAIQSAVNAVMGAQPSKSDLALARRLLVPSLVQVDQDGVKRRVARRQDLPADAQGLADRFVAQRLLVTDAGNIEVAHEAILRQWPTLAAWIADERAALAELSGIRAAMLAWRGRIDQKARRGERRHNAWLVHRGERLKSAESLLRRTDFGGGIDEDMRDYISACKRRQYREGVIVSATAAVLVLSAAVATVTFFDYYKNSEIRVYPPQSVRMVYGEEGAGFIFRSSIVNLSNFGDTAVRHELYYSSDPYSSDQLELRSDGAFEVRELSRRADGRNSCRPVLGGSACIEAPFENSYLPPQQGATTDIFFPMTREGVPAALEDIQVLLRGDSQVRYTVHTHRDGSHTTSCRVAGSAANVERLVQRGWIDLRCD